MAKASRKAFVTPISKTSTGIAGLDVITNGGIPENRSTLLLGNTGCGKTIMSMEFLIRGIEIFNETAVFISFEEKVDELELNVNSIGFNLNKHRANKKLYIDCIQIKQQQLPETGSYDIEGIFVRLNQAINKVKAKRVVLDSLDTLLSNFNPQLVRFEFKRLISWLKDKKVTAVITGELGNLFLNGDGALAYVADCVMVLDNRVVNQITTRRLRIVKYRGSTHGNNEYPFIIDERGITVLPIINNALDLPSSSKRISSGLADLDRMLDNQGFFVGSSVLISGTAGTGKTSIASSFAYSVCQEKKRCLLCAFEEAPNQIIRNMRSIGFNLTPFVKADLLTFYYARPTLQNLELHFISIKKIIQEQNPTVVILDPITNLMTEGPNSDIRSMLTRFVDYLKTQQITVLFTAAITVGSIEKNPSDEGISSMVDTWMIVQDIEVDAERTRSLCIMKSRGMVHSNTIHRFIISSKGIRLLPLRQGENNHTRTDFTPENVNTSKLSNKVKLPAKKQKTIVGRILSK